MSSPLLQLTEFSVEKIFLKLVRKVAYLDKSSDVDLLDSMLKEKPELLKYKLRKNYCGVCNEFSNGDMCKELDCKTRKKPHCIPTDNTLG